MERGLSYILEILKKESQEDMVIYNFLKDLLQTEVYEQPGWYKDTYHEMVDKYVDEWGVR